MRSNWLETLNLNRDLEEKNLALEVEVGILSLRDEIGRLKAADRQHRTNRKIPIKRHIRF
ncbi:MAG: hypothetical protein LBN01_01410 [Endomicrobium sp.]|jgi:hypothetical protein|nr:hypothetical protein [Endomicrobium sp.]